MSEYKKLDSIIIGGGIAGLSYALELFKAGKSFAVLEKNSFIGGSWVSKPYKNTFYELGPNTFMNNNEFVNQVIKDLNLESELLTCKFKDSKRFLFLDGKLKEAKTNPLEFAASGILSTWAMLRALSEVFIKAESKTNESVFDFISRRFGKDVAERLVQTFMQGIWAGDIKKLSAKAGLKALVEHEAESGSVIKGMLKSIINKKQDPNKQALATHSFKNGIQQMCAAFENKLGEQNIFKNSLVKISNYKDETFYLETWDKEKEITHNFCTENLVLASKAYEASELLRVVSPILSTQLAEIYYAPIALVVFSIPKHVFKQDKLAELDGFGMLSGDAKIQYSLGSIWSSQLFKEKNLDDEILMVNFIGGAKNPQVLDFTDEILKNITYREQMEFLYAWLEKDLRYEDFNFIEIKQIAKAIPQYNLGYEKIMQDIQTSCQKLPGLQLCGNYVAGVSLANTIEHAIKAAKSFCHLSQTSSLKQAKI